MRGEHVAYFNNASGEYRRLMREAEAEFGALSDYIWKTPRLLEAEEELERRKLDAYFPPDDTSDLNQKLRALRAGMEFKKIWIDFPIFQRMSNLMMVISVFELHLVRLVDLPDHGMPKARAPHGVADAMQRVVERQATFEDDDCYLAVDSAIKIRNRLVHSGGKLGSSRRCEEARLIISSMSYASRSHQAHWAAKFPDLKPVQVWSSNDGDRIRLEENYPHIVSGYCRDLYMSACIALDENYTA